MMNLKIGTAFVLLVFVIQLAGRQIPTLAGPTAQEQNATTGVVTGTIRTKAGTPAPKIRVTAIAAPDSSAATAGLQRSDITDALGRYRIESLPPGRYLIAAGDSPYFSYYPGGAVASEARALTVNAGSIAQNVDFLTLGPGIVRGSVNKIPPGLPADVIKVVLRSMSTPGFRRDPKAGSPLAVDGTFELLDVHPGSYTVLTNPQPFFAFGDDGPRPQLWQSTIRVDREILDVQLELPAVIFGRVSIDDGSSLPMAKDGEAQGKWSQISVSAGMFASAGVGVAPSLYTGVRTPVRSDGWFIMPQPPGERRTVAIDLPPGYDLKSITSGGAELPQNRLPTTASSIEIRVTLSRRLDQPK